MRAYPNAICYGFVVIQSYKRFWCNHLNFLRSHVCIIESLCLDMQFFSFDSHTILTNALIIRSFSCQFADRRPFTFFHQKQKWKLICSPRHQFKFSSAQDIYRWMQIIFFFRFKSSTTIKKTRIHDMYRQFNSQNKKTTRVHFLIM